MIAQMQRSTIKFFSRNKTNKLCNMMISQMQGSTILVRHSTKQPERNCCAFFFKYRNTFLNRRKSNQMLKLKTIFLEKKNKKSFYVIYARMYIYFFKINYFYVYLYCKTNLLYYYCVLLFLYVLFFVFVCMIKKYGVMIRITCYVMELCSYLLLLYVLYIYLVIGFRFFL